MTVAVFSVHIHTLLRLSVGVSAAAAWSMAAAVGAAERDEALRNKRSNLLDEITMADESCFVAFASYIDKSAPCRHLTGCLHSAPFEALCSFIQCDVTIMMAAPSLTGSECDNTNDGKESDEDCGDDLHRGVDYLRVFVHEYQEGLNAVSTIPGLAQPLAFALSPAVISVPCVEADPLAVEFTQQLSSVCAANPALALSHVSQRCLADDLMSVLSRPPPPVLYWCPIRNTLRCGGCLFAWPSMHVTMLNGCVFCLAGTRETSVCADASAKVFVDGSRRK
ncbi:hypothetical protein C3747_61g155 [Trypanosoma cruzi]|uniref:Uncharacterized protein n=2 Tax=Trypanosoma cruzi TaxID=5693 RepID=Q4E1G3_TRYCC|nr:hypothetical protein Tc00.1047053510483.200 [Trypanosoma cruzi]EAN98613.1 hypothetical protein Tc00.1047053510483.200 [Trypanosoma cruzi]PWV11281.1 hypothetical protein C3747_61g155 [Trypanosoma cruzi]|eukprot:XP_820464.1 hypothetical protein [Trypanosoma cruzi strain CL Brener]